MHINKSCIMIVIAGYGVCYDGNIVSCNGQSATLLRKV